MDEMQRSQFLIYRSEDGRIKLDVRFLDDTVWLTQAMIVELFQSSKANVSEHIANIFAEGELTPEATVRKFRTVRQEGARQVERELEFYNLDLIISVGYRIKSKVATQFRIWATQHLSEFIRKGFVLDDERLKNPDQPFDYFDELLERIQAIRTSEKRFYQKITDIYATSIDYDPTADISIRFFQTVQALGHHRTDRCRNHCFPRRPYAAQYGPHQFSRGESPEGRCCDRQELSFPGRDLCVE